MDYAIGVDLHGTLMEDGEYIREDLKKPLIDALNAVRGVYRLYVATGNDLTFVKRKIPGEVLSLFDGLILETGCVLSDGSCEEVLVESEVVSKIKGLESRLRGEGFDWVYKFDRRLAMIAAFTRYGQSPRERKRDVANRVERWGAGEFCYVTYSSVAVDVVPNGFSKLTGIKRAADGLGVIGIADSMNDIDLHLGSDFSFAPSNIAPELRAGLLGGGRRVVELENARKVESQTTYVASKPATEGVIEVLDFLARA